MAELHRVNEVIALNDFFNKPQMVNWPITDGLEFRHHEAEKGFETRVEFPSGQESVYLGVARLRRISGGAELTGVSLVYDPRIFAVQVIPVSREDRAVYDALVEKMQMEEWIVLSTDLDQVVGFKRIPVLAG